MVNELVDTFSFINYLIAIVIIIIWGLRPSWGKKTFTIFKKDTAEIPGPTALPLLGTQWVFPVKGYTFNKLHEYYNDLYKKYGRIVKEETLFNIPIISIYEKNEIEKVLKSSGKYPIRPPTEAIAYYRRSRPDRYASTGLVNEQGETWFHLRSSLTTELTSPKTISSFLPVVQEIADDWCHLLHQMRDQNHEIHNLEDITGRLGLEISCALVLGRRMGFLIPGGESETAKELGNAIHEYFIAMRDTYYGLPLWKLMETKDYKKLVKSEETIYRLASELIKSANDTTHDSAVFQSVVKANIDEKEKTAAIIDFIAAGIHTLKNSLVFLLCMVAEHPETQDKIIEDFSKTYLKACVTETFRFLPTANLLARVTQEDLVLSGYKIKSGSVVLCHNGIACRDERNFKNANSFCPERWLGEEKLQTSNSATFLVTPFGAGRRICPGKRFIEQVLPVLLEHIVNNFEIRIVKPLELHFEFLLSPKGPTTLILKDRI